MDKTVSITGREAFFGDDEIIVSKTDLKGHITYANDVFLRIAGYTEAEVLGKPHSIIRHPHMPRCIFKLLWDTIAAGDEIFAYVVNHCKNGARSATIETGFENHLGNVGLIQGMVGDKMNLMTGYIVVPYVVWIEISTFTDANDLAFHQAH